MNILLACQCSGELRELLRDMGHNALTCDLKPAEDGSPHHIQGDAIRSAYEESWDCMIAMPECRYLCSSGQHHNDKPGQRTLQDVEDAVLFATKLKDAPIKHKCIENSIGILSTRWRKPDQIIQPHWFGDDASKSTALWMMDFPLLKPNDPVAPRAVIYKGKVFYRWSNQTDSGQNKLGPSPTRSADRARTYPGVARAFATAVKAL
jgi:hypothetical protein